MQQVRTHFSAAYELPLLTRAENYAQVSPSPEMPALAPRLQEWASQRRAQPPQMGLLKPSAGVGLFVPERGRRGPFLPALRAGPGLAGCREGQARTERLAFSSAMFVPFAVGIGSKAG